MLVGIDDLLAVATPNTQCRKSNDGMIVHTELQMGSSMIEHMTCVLYTHKRHEHDQKRKIKNNIIFRKILYKL